MSGVLIKLASRFKVNLNLKLAFLQHRSDQEDLWQTTIQLQAQEPRYKPQRARMRTALGYEMFHHNNHKYHTSLSRSSQLQSTTIVKEKTMLATLAIINMAVATTLIIDTAEDRKTQEVTEMVVNTESVQDATNLIVIEKKFK